MTQEREHERQDRSRQHRERLAAVEARKRAIDEVRKDFCSHLIRIYHRGYSRGLFISATEFTAAALSTCVEALQRTVISLVTFPELTRLLESHGDFPAFLLEKIRIAIVDKQPYGKVLV